MNNENAQRTLVVTKPAASFNAEINERLNAMLDASYGALRDSGTDNFTTSEQISGDLDLGVTVGWPSSSAVQVSGDDIDVQDAGDIIINDNMNYYAQLCSSTGVKPPKDFATRIMLCDSRNAVNKEFFANLESFKQAVPSFDESQKNFMQYSFDVKASKQYIDLKYALDSAMRRSLEHAIESERYLNTAASNRSSLEMLVASPPLDFSVQIEKLIQGGWWFFDIKKSIDETEKKNGLKHYVFITPNITLTHKNAAAKLDLVVPMGSYKVAYCPQNMSVRVVSNHSTRQVSVGYIHPHISTDYTVCWGNVKELVLNAMKANDLGTIFESLQVILTNYNEASPYAALQQWDYLHNAHKYSIEYVRRSDTDRYVEDYDYQKLNPQHIVSMYDDEESEIDVPDSWDNFGDAELVYKVYFRYFRKQIAGSSTDDTTNYVMLVDGSYAPLESLAL